MDACFVASLTRSVAVAASSERGLAGSGFFLEYQGITDAGGTFGGAEALLRYSYDGKVVSPMAFIPTLQEIGIFHGLVRPIIDQVIMDAQCIAAVRPQFSLSINLSSDQLLDASMIDYFRVRLARASLSPGLFGIEVSEQDSLTPNSRPFLTLKMFGDAGHPLLIDDYGIGFSNVSRIIELTTQVIKLDRALLLSIDDFGQRSLIAIRKVIELAHELGSRVTCEGIETRPQFDLMVQSGSDYFQGFFIARPTAIGTLIDRLVADPLSRHGRVFAFTPEQNRASA
jgi:EAL domain-containing protein (putative c-di-GMP-specific phosphodiesterase class I)